MKKYITGLALIILIGHASIGYTQDIYNIKNTKDVEIKINGTSTLHDWEMNTKNATGVAQFIFKSVNENELTSLESLTFTIKVKDFKSDSKGLYKNAYKALKANMYKKIYYELSSSTRFPEKGGYLLHANGKLTIAWITKDMIMDVHIIVNENGTIACKGSYKLNMTDYNVDPPSFLLGAMKTGDAITIGFDVIYIKQNGS